jgi:hypothetical protein
MCSKLSDKEIKFTVLLEEAFRKQKKKNIKIYLMYLKNENK